MLLKKTTFICLDCEFTGLDPENDRIIEMAAVRFNLSEILDQYEVLVNPEYPISEEAFAIHHISQQMVSEKPKIHEVLAEFLSFIDRDMIMGHAVGLDIDMLTKAAERAQLPSILKSLPMIDTLRLARLYGDSPNNSLENLAAHFNVPNPGAHRAMNDVIMNIEVFKHLVRKYKTVEQLMNVLSRPIKMKFMPLGKHKGRPFNEIPLQYLRWAANMKFDQDLLFSIRLELKQRKKGGGFTQAINPFEKL